MEGSLKETPYEKRIQRLRQVKTGINMGFILILPTILSGK